MNVQFNLLPDVKLDYTKAQAERNRTTSLSVLVSLICVAILIILVVLVDVGQKKQLSDANSQISQATSELQAVPNLSKVLTVQNQLSALANLHSRKHITSRLFGYLSQATPGSASLGQLTMDLTKNTLTLSGTADNQTTVNTFIDNLKTAQYQVGSSAAQTAFPSVVESSFSINQTNVSYSLSLKLAPQLFANNFRDSSGNLVAPKLIIKDQPSTRSLDQIFNGQLGG